HQVPGRPRGNPSHRLPGAPGEERAARVRVAQGSMEARLQRGAEPMAAQEYKEVRTREQLTRLLGHWHFIPMGRGFTQAHVAENYPGWTWNQLVRVLTAAG